MPCFFPRVSLVRWLSLGATGAAVIFALLACQARRTTPAVEKRVVSNAGSAKPRAGQADPGPIRMEALDSAAKAPVFVMRGAPRGTGRLAFLHGMCGHGLGYAQAFQFSAAKRGTLIAPQADVSCGGPFSKWSSDVAALDARIVQTFEALAQPGGSPEVIIIGMSQGAERAVALVKRYPERYTRLISMDAPTALKPGQLRSLRAAVMMAGELDRQDLMQKSARALTVSGVPVTFLVIPRAGHGAMGPNPEQTMGAALDWLWAH
jgi:pimeloyl-ACP methyl ester carboxylesterase